MLPKSSAHGVCCLPCEASLQGKILNVAADLRTLLQQQGLDFEEQASLSQGLGCNPMDTGCCGKIRWAGARTGRSRMHNLCSPRELSCQQRRTICTCRA